MAKETSEVLVRALPFSGKPEEWDVWSDKFLSIAQAKGYVKALYPGDVLPADVTLDETVDANKLAQKALDRNYNAMSALTMAISDYPVGKSYLEHGKTAAFPRGVARVVWAKLVAKHVPTNTAMIARLRSALADCKQNKAESPTDYCSRLIAMQNKLTALRATCPDETLVTQFELGCLKDYRVTYRNMVNQLVAAPAGTVLTLEDIETEMMHLYVLEDEDAAPKSASELALIAESETKFEKRFKKGGIPSKKGEGKGKFSGKCNRCGKVGHKEAQYWDDPTNSDRRPKSWKTNGTRTESNVAEIALAVYEAATDRCIATSLSDVEDYPNEGFYCNDYSVQSAEEPVAVSANRFVMHHGVPCALFRLECGNQFYTFMDTTFFDTTFFDTTIFVDIFVHTSFVGNEESCENEDDDFSYSFCQACGLTFDSMTTKEVEEEPYWDADAPIGRQILYEVDGSFVLAATNGDGATELLGCKDIMVADTGASCHIFTSMDWMTNMQTSSESRGICIGGQRVVQHQGVGDLPVTFKAKDGRVCASVTLMNVKISKEFGFNLFSLTRAMSHGWSIRSENKAIIVFNDTSKIVFDVVVETGNGGMLLFALIEPGLRSDQTEIAAVASSQPGTRMSLMKAHQLFGHPNEDLTREMAKTLGIEITRGKVLTCEDCSIAKAKQRNLPSIDDDKTVPTENGQLLHLDMMSVKVPKGLTLNKKQLRMIVDAHSRVEFLEAYAKKSDMPDDTCRLFQLLRENGVEIKRLCMDNGGENKSLANMLKSKDSKFPLKIEYTARDTPQQNSLVETAFAANVRRSLAVYVAAGVPQE
jgi:hypothetical protein